MRQLGGALEVAILAVVFATNGGYASAAAFTDGYGRAMPLAAGIAFAAAIAGAALPARTNTAGATVAGVERTAAPADVAA
jgi:hypothetical protein